LTKYRERKTVEEKASRDEITKKDSNSDGIKLKSKPHEKALPTPPSPESPRPPVARTKSVKKKALPEAPKIELPQLPDATEEVALESKNRLAEIKTGSPLKPSTEDWEKQQAMKLKRGTSGRVPTMMPISNLELEAAAAAEAAKLAATNAWQPPPRPLESKFRSGHPNEPGKGRSSFILGVKPNPTTGLPPTPPAREQSKKMPETPAQSKEPKEKTSREKAVETAKKESSKKNSTKKKKKDLEETRIKRRSSVAVARMAQDRKSISMPESILKLQNENLENEIKRLQESQKMKFEERIKELEKQLSERDANLEKALALVDTLKVERTSEQGQEIKGYFKRKQKKFSKLKTGK